MKSYIWRIVSSSRSSLQRPSTELL